jgi:F-type H+-transporting ATPase subunit c
MVQASVPKIIGTGLVTLGVIGASVGIGVVIGALILGFSFTGGYGLFALMNGFLFHVAYYFLTVNRRFLALFL